MSSPSTSSSIAPEGWLDDRMLNAVLHDQREMLAKLEKANETLDTCNTLSHQRIDAYATDFKHHVKLLLEMKKDLESLYKRLRIVQTKVSKLYPANYADAVSKAEMHEIEEDEND
ncbi:kxDL motif-containing protein CG10681-like [Paramacrobiotus metropolitanus]|nr:kxDL motif-containing protein CG10681-like [Paramacrobiotus metropolitanus]